jgi:hypothetical protein
LKELGYQGRVIVPEHDKPQAYFDYNTQVEWENLGTEKCTKMVFWVPRELTTMPAFTTNVEFGRYAKSGKIVYGRPENSPQNKYLDWLYLKFNPGPIYTSLTELLAKAIAKAG